MDAGPPFSKENWKVVATASHADWIIISKLMDDGRLIKRYRVHRGNVSGGKMRQQIEPVVTYLEKRLAKTIIIDTDLLLVGLFHRHGRADLGFSLDSLHYCDYYLLRYAGLMVASARDRVTFLISASGIFPR